MTSDLIVALDPGETTGIAIYYAEDDQEYQFLEIAGTLTEIYDMLFDFMPDRVVYEEFRYRPTQGHALLVSREVIGVVKLFCEQHHTPTLDSYPPASTKPFWTDDKIKKLGLWRPGMGHAMDALRLLLRHRQTYEPQWFQDTLMLLK